MPAAIRNAFIGLVLFIVIATAPGKVNQFRDWIMNSAAHLGNAAATNVPKKPGARGQGQGVLSPQGHTTKILIHNPNKKPVHRPLHQKP
jgi:hypothetical protein